MINETPAWNGFGLNERFEKATPHEIGAAGRLDIESKTIIKPVMTDVIGELCLLRMTDSWRHRDRNISTSAFMPKRILLDQQVQINTRDMGTALFFLILKSSFRLPVASPRLLDGWWRRESWQFGNGNASFIHANRLRRVGIPGSGRSLFTQSERYTSWL